MTTSELSTLVDAAFQQMRRAAVLVAPDAGTWTVLAVNDAYLAATRLSREGLLGRPLLSRFPENVDTAAAHGAAQVTGTLRDALESRAATFSIVRYDLPSTARPDEFEERYWEMTSVSIRDTADRVIAVLHEVVDVTRRTLAEREAQAMMATIAEQNQVLQDQAMELEITNQQLQENAVEMEMQAEELQVTAAQLEERTAAAEASQRATEAAERQLQTALAQAPAAVAVTTGPEHRYVLANRAYEALVGRGITPGRTFAEALPELEAQGFTQLLDQVYRTGEPYVAHQTPARVARPDGALEDGWFDFVYQPLVDPHGRVIGVLQQGIDVTERVRAEALLRESEAQLRTLADAIPTLAWTARADGFIEWYNRQWYQYTGTTPEQMEGWGWQTVHDAEHLPEVLAQWTRSIETGGPFEMTFPLRGADGRFRSFLTRVNPIRDGEGRVVRWFGTNTDVELETEARRHAEEANEAKTNFLATMSHELRTPLNALGGYLDLLLLGLRGPLTAEQRSDLERMQRSHRHLMTLINDILNFAKIDSGRPELEIGRVDVGAVLRRVEELVHPQCAAKGIHCSLEVPAPAPAALADEERVGQILLNLLSNAVKYTPEGGRIVASCALREDAVHVCVRDSGVGIPSDQLDTIFDPFVQVGRRLNAPGEGVGLGLAISRSLAEAMQGTLEVESEVGAGSAFTLHLPAAAPADREVAAD